MAEVRSVTCFLLPGASRGHRAAVRAVAVLAVLAAGVTGLAAPAAATPTITQQGTAGHPFTWTSLPSALEVVDGDEGDQDLRLALTVIDRVAQGSPIYGDESCDARSVEALDNGNLLFSDRSLPIVAEVTRAGEPVWTYSVADDPSLRRPFSAQRFSRAGQDLTLISDRDAKRVWAVDEDKRVVWQYGVTNEGGLGVNHLLDPFCARYSELDGGTVVIADTLDASRVIVVRYGDYVAGAPDNGFTEESIVWSYGTPGSAGSGPGQLDKPHGVDRLANGNILVADEDAQRVIEIDWETKEIPWQYGITDQAGDGPGQLKEPNAARRLSDGDTLIADAGNARVLRVSADGTIDREYDMKSLARPSWHAENDPSSPRQAVYTRDGLLVVADSLFQQIVLLGHEGFGQATSTPLDCGQPGVKKAFVSLTWKGDTGHSGTKVTVDYRLDGGAWRTCTVQVQARLRLPRGDRGQDHRLPSDAEQRARGAHPDARLRRHPVDDGHDRRQRRRRRWRGGRRRQLGPERRLHVSVDRRGRHRDVGDRHWTRAAPGPAAAPGAPARGRASSGAVGGPSTATNAARRARRFDGQRGASIRPGLRGPGRRGRERRAAPRGRGAAGARAGAAWAGGARARAGRRRSGRGGGVLRALAVRRRAHASHHGVRPHAAGAVPAVPAARQVTPWTS